MVKVLNKSLFHLLLWFVDMVFGIIIIENMIDYGIRLYVVMIGDWKLMIVDQ